MKAIWTEEKASYTGEFVEFDRIWAWPKPAQRPHPPILVGGNGPTVIDRVLRFGDAWMPNYARADFRAQVGELRSRAERVIDLQVMGIPPKPQVIEELDALGASRVLTWLPSTNWSGVEVALERWETAIAAYTGEA